MISCPLCNQECEKKQGEYTFHKQERFYCKRCGIDDYVPDCWLSNKNIYPEHVVEWYFLENHVVVQSLWPPYVLFKLPWMPLDISLDRLKKLLILI